MSNNTIFEKITSLVKKIADNNALELTPESAFEDIENWDSLNTVDLEMEIEQEFSISFETGEFQEYKTIAQLIDAISKKVDN